MSDSEVNTDEPIDTPVDAHDEADDQNWRLAVLITDDGAKGADAKEDATEVDVAEVDAGVKTIPRRHFASGQDFAVEVLIADRVIAVFRHAGTWYAIDGMCSHQGGPLADGVVRDGCVTCPWHGWQYDLATGIQMINHQPLQESFPIRQIDDRVEIRLSLDNLR